MEITKEQRGKIFQNLPDEIKDVFTAYETTQKLIQVGDKYNLSEEERGELGEATGLVLLGILDVKEFQEYLHKNINGPTKEVNRLVREVQEEIFQPIAGSLKKLDPEKILRKVGNEEVEEEKVKETIPVPTPPSDDTPSPSYGGTSDPYREPVDD